MTTLWKYEFSLRSQFLSIVASAAKVHMNHSDVAQVSCTMLVMCFLNKASQALKKTETRHIYKEQKKCNLRVKTTNKWIIKNE